MRLKREIFSILSSKRDLFSREKASERAAQILFSSFRQKDPVQYMKDSLSKIAFATEDEWLDGTGWFGTLQEKRK